MERAWKRHFGWKIPPEEDMLRKYRCVFDVNGNTYSQRLKFLLSANGVIVTQESPCTARVAAGCCYKTAWNAAGGGEGEPNNSPRSSGHGSRRGPGGERPRRPVHSEDETKPLGGGVER